MTPEVSAFLESLAPILIQVILTVGGIYIAMVNIKPQIIDKQAEAQVDLAKANTRTISNTAESVSLHNEAINALIKRDLEFVELNRNLAEMKSRISELEDRHRRQIDALSRELQATKEQLDVERLLREGYQRSLDQERQRNSIHPTQPVLPQYSVPANSVNPPVVPMTPTPPIQPPAPSVPVQQPLTIVDKGI